MTITDIGVVEAIARYPVKSMRAEPLRQAELRWTGLHGDRLHAFVRSGNRSRFPWLTGREVADLVLHKAVVSEPGESGPPVVRVVTPDGQDLAIDDPALLGRLADAAGEPVNLIHVGRGCFDAMPVSVIATATGAALQAASGKAVALERFRINLVIRTDDGIGRETEWLGGTLAFGDGPSGPRINLGWAIPRCAMVTIDPDTAEKDPTVLRMVAQDFANQIGAYGAVGVPGMISVGDRVRLHRPA